MRIQRELSDSSWTVTAVCTTYLERTTPVELLRLYIGLENWGTRVGGRILLPTSSAKWSTRLRPDCDGELRTSPCPGPA